MISRMKQKLNQFTSTLFGLFLLSLVATGCQTVAPPNSLATHNSKQWEREIQTKLKDGHQLKTYILYGSRTKVGWKNLKKYDVVLTTPGTLAAEYKRKESSWEQKKASAGDRLSDEEGPSLPCLSEDSLWYR